MHTKSPSHTRKPQWSYKPHITILGTLNRWEKYAHIHTHTKSKPTSLTCPDTKHVHFRGRHLYGTSLPLPTHYTGAVLSITDRLAPTAQSSSQHPPETDASVDADPDADVDADLEDEVLEEVKIAEQLGEFDEIVVWGHGGEVDEGSDMFVRGMREWVGFAESMHCDEDTEDVEGVKKTSWSPRKWGGTETL
jgi:ribonuclease H2 subunit C